MRRTASPTGRISKRQLALFITFTLIGILLGLQASPLEDAPGLSIREQDGQLMIAWTPPAPSPGGRLEIIDGGSHTIIPVYAYLSGVTYTRRSGDVQVRLICGAQERAARFVARDDATAAHLSEQFSDLAAEARSLRIATESRLWRTAQLQFSANRLLWLVEKPRR